MGALPCPARMKISHTAAQKKLENLQENSSGLGNVYVGEVKLEELIEDYSSKQHNKSIGLVALDFWGIIYLR